MTPEYLREVIRLLAHQVSKLESEYPTLHELSAKRANTLSRLALEGQIAQLASFCTEAELCRLGVPKA